jgi:hypothetical protein
MNGEVGPAGGPPGLAGPQGERVYGTSRSSELCASRRRLPNSIEVYCEPEPYLNGRSGGSAAIGTVPFEDVEHHLNVRAGRHRAADGPLAARIVDRG